MWIGSAWRSSVNCLPTGCLKVRLVGCGSGCGWLTMFVHSTNNRCVLLCLVVSIIVCTDLFRDATLTKLSVKRSLPIFAGHPQKQTPKRSAFPRNHTQQGLARAPLAVVLGYIVKNWITMSLAHGVGKDHESSRVFDGFAHGRGKSTRKTPFLKIFGLLTQTTE